MRQGPWALSQTGTHARARTDGDGHSYSTTDRTGLKYNRRNPLTLFTVGLTVSITTK